MCHNIPHLHPTTLTNKLQVHRRELEEHKMSLEALAVIPDAIAEFPTLSCACDAIASEMTMIDPSANPD